MIEQLLVTDYASFSRRAEQETTSLAGGDYRLGFRLGMHKAFEILSAWHSGTETPPEAAVLTLRIFTVDSTAGTRVPLYYFGAAYDPVRDVFFVEDGSVFDRTPDVEWRVFIE